MLYSLNNYSLKRYNGINTLETEEMDHIVGQPEAFDLAGFNVDVQKINTVPPLPGVRNRSRNRLESGFTAKKKSNKL